jgi:DNA-binding response OmpR family regulator
METILIVDVDSERADLICTMMRDHNVPATRCHNISETRCAIEPENSPAVIVMHCALIENSFTEVAKLRKHPHVQLVFYCTDAGQKTPGIVTKLPEDLSEILLRITEKKRLLLKAS